MYRSKLATALTAAHVPQPVSRLATGSVAAADGVGQHLGGPAGARLAAAAHTAFSTAMATGMRVAAVVALVAAVGVAFALPARRRPGTAVLPQPDAAGARPDAGAARPDAAGVAAGAR